MTDAPAPSPPSLPDSPLLYHLVSQLTVIKAQAQMIRRSMDDAEVMDDSQERAFMAIDSAVDRAMTQLLIAARNGRMPLEPLETDEDAA